MNDHDVLIRRADYVDPSLRSHSLSRDLDTAFAQAVNLEKRVQAFLARCDRFLEEVESDRRN